MTRILRWRRPIFFGDLAGVLGELAFDAVLSLGGGRRRLVGSLVTCDGKA